MLVVDDEIAIQRAARRVLESRGHRVCTCGEATAALARLREDAFDVLLTDVLMPAVAGPELAARARALCPDLRVVFMSGYTQGLLPGAGGGEVAFLEKPFSPDDLATAIADAMAEAPGGATTRTRRA